MCRAGGKDYADWSRLMGSHQLMQALENQLALSITQDNFQNSNLTLGDLSEQICADRSFTCKKVNPSNATEMDRLISGTYCHPSLIPHIACWVSPDFALKVSEIINFFIVEGKATGEWPTITLQVQWVYQWNQALQFRWKGIQVQQRTYPNS